MLFTGMQQIDKKNTPTVVTARENFFFFFNFQIRVCGIAVVTA